jgi:hypothetical protein
MPPFSGTILTGNAATHVENAAYKRNGMKTGIRLYIFIYLN